MRKTLQYQNHTISYQRIGHGKALVLVHGFGEDGTIFKSQIEDLKNECLLIIPDLPGSGLSDFNPSLVSIADFATTINALLVEENIGECTMLGHSMGGYITLSFAEYYGSKLIGFGLIHSTAFADSNEKKLAREKGIELIEAYGAYPFLKNTIPNLFGKAFKATSPEVVNALIEDGKQFSPAALQQYYLAMKNRHDKTDILKGSKCPVLFIMGTEDVAAPLNDMLQQTILPECSYIHVLDGIGHMSMLEAPHKLSSFILEFINR